MDLLKLLRAEHSKKNTDRIVGPYFKPLLDNLDRTDIHVAVIRNTVRLLQDVSIPKRYHGRVMNTCFRFVEAPETPIAVKVFSMTILSQLAAEYPEIGPELKLLIDDQWEHATAAFRSRAKKALKQIGWIANANEADGLGSGQMGPDHGS